MSLCPTLVGAPRFEQVNTFRQWLLPILRKAFTRYAVFPLASAPPMIISQEQDAMSPPILLRAFTMSVEIMAVAQCFDPILEVSRYAFWT